MKRLKEKLKNKSGETIGEVLVSLLISALALTMLAGAIGSSYGIIQTGRTKEKEYYTANEILTKKTGSSSVATLSIGTGHVSIEGQSPIDITYYMNTVFKAPVVSYKKRSSG